MDNPTGDRKALLDAIVTAGRILGHVLDNPKIRAAQRNSALSEAYSTLGVTYLLTTGQPWKWPKP